LYGKKSPADILAQSQPTALPTEAEGQGIGVPDALKDVESTANALKKVPVKTKITDTATAREFNPKSNDVIAANNENNSWDKALRMGAKDIGDGWYKVGESNGDPIVYSPSLDRAFVLTDTKGGRVGTNLYRFIQNNNGDANALAEAYHAAKKDGSNPELVKAVEDLLAPDASKKGEKIDMKEERVDEVNISEQPAVEVTATDGGGETPSVSKEKPKKPSKLQKLADDLDSFADELGGSLGANAAAVAAAARALAKVLRSVDNMAQALAEWRKSDEYKALEPDDVKNIESRVSEKVGDDYVPPTPEKEEKKETPQRKLRGVIEAYVNRSDLDQETKDALLADDRSYYETLGIEAARDLAKGIIADLGIEDAVSLSDRPNSPVPVELQSLVYGEALIYAKEQGQKAKTVNEKDKWADYQLDVKEKLAAKATAYGRYNSYIESIYENSAYSIVRKSKKEIEKRNKIFAPNAQKAAKDVAKTLDSKDEMAEAVEEAVNRILGETVAEKDRIIKELEDKIKKIQSEPKAGKPQKQRSFKREKLDELRRKAFGKAAANPFLDPQVWEYLSYASGYYLESGYYKFADFYKKMRRDTKGKYEEYFAELYEEAKEALIERGVEAELFDTPEVVTQLAEEMYKEGEALKAKLEEEKNAKKAKLDLDKAAKKAEREAAKKIKDEAKKWEGKGLEKQIKEALIDAGYGKEVGGKMQVDWKKVTTDSRDAAPVVAKIKEALKDRIPADILASIMPIIESEANRIVVEKKKRAVKTKVEAYKRGRLRGVGQAVRRNTRIQGLVETWKQGGLTDADVLEKLASDFGVVAFSKEDERSIEKLVEEIDSMDAGAEKERLEERLQAYLEYLGSPQFLTNAFLERMKARLLSGPVTALKNMTGSIDAVIDTTYNVLVNQVSRQGIGDKEILRAVTKAHKKAFWTAMDVLWRGGIDKGTAMSEITKNKEGSPSVRYMENPRMAFKDVGLFHKLGGYSGIMERPFMRFMSAFDTFNQVIAEESEAYTYIKAQLRRANPYMSNKELNRRAYEAAFAVEINEAEKQAEKEYAEKGIDITDFAGRTRYNRRVHEIIEQKRGEDVLRAQQFYGNRTTYKATDPFFFSSIGLAVNEFKQAGSRAIRKVKSKTKNPNAIRALELGEFMWKATMDFLIPFVKSVSNILEKSMELTPVYGGIKAAAYTAMAGYNKSKGIESDYDFRRAGQYYYRAAVGALISALILAAADDDEEEKMKMIFGEGPENWKEAQNISKMRPANTIRINGNNISLDWFGPFAVNLKTKAALEDAKRYNKEGFIALSVLSAALNNMYFEQTGRILTEATNYLKSGDDRKISAMLKRLSAEYSTRMTIPATSFFRQAGQLVDAEAKKPVTFAEQLMKYSGLLQPMIDRPALDYRGKTYDTGQIYTSSADGFVKMFKDAIKVDEVDRLVFTYNPSIAGPNRGGEAYRIMEDGDYVPMSDEQFYEVSKMTGENLDHLLKIWAENPVPTSDYEVTPARQERIVRMAEEQLSDLGIMLTNENIRRKAQDILEEESYREKMKATINDINTKARNYAVYQFYVNNNLRVPINYYDAEAKYLKKEKELIQGYAED